MCLMTTNDEIICIIVRVLNRNVDDLTTAHSTPAMHFLLREALGILQA